MITVKRSVSQFRPAYQSTLLRPKTLVAFAAVGLTLFTLTLWLNIVALYVVCKILE